MTVAELIAELETKDPAALVIRDYEHHGNWYLGEVDGLDDLWVKHESKTLFEYESVDEGTVDALKAVRVW